MFSRNSRSVAPGEVQRPEGSCRTIDRGRSGKSRSPFTNGALLPSNNKLQTGVTLKEKREDPAGSLAFTDFLHPSIIVRHVRGPPFVSFTRSAGASGSPRIVHGNLSLLRDAKQSAGVRYVASSRVTFPCRGAAE